MRCLRKGPLAAAVAILASFALLGAALVGSSGLGWYSELVKPWFLVPLWAFYLVGLVYYVLGAVVLYRVLVHVDDPRGRAISFTLTVGVLSINELWNYGFFGMRSTLAGFVGILVFLMPLTALIVALRTHERFSARMLVPYYVWVLYDLAWTYQLWRLNGAAYLVGFPIGHDRRPSENSSSRRYGGRKIEGDVRVLPSTEWMRLRSSRPSSRRRPRRGSRGGAGEVAGDAPPVCYQRPGRLTKMCVQASSRARTIP